MANQTRANTRQIITAPKLDGTISRLLQSKVDELFSVKDFGATGDGVTDDTVNIISAKSNQSMTGSLVFPAGLYLITGDITFSKTVEFKKGAILIIRNATVRFDGEVIAGLYKIFDTTDDFVANYLLKPSVKKSKGVVFPEWFGAVTVNTYEELASSFDCSTAFHKAWHATCGEFNVTPEGTSNFYQSELFHSYVYMSPGKYRIDNHLKLWHRVTSPTTIRYNKNGGGIIGSGMGLSMIVLTNPNDLSNAAVELSDMSGEMHTFIDFKVTFYNFNVTGDERWFGRTGAGLLISSSDSVYTANLWSAGFKYLRLDGDGVRRGGTGIQFESLVDHFYSNLLAEHNIHGIAFSSCVSTGVGIKGFLNTVSDLAFGNFIPAWPNLISQVGANIVTLCGMESKACPATPIYFGTKDNTVSLTNISVKGNGESSSTIVTSRVIAFNTAGEGAGATGLIQGNVVNVNYGLIDDGTTAFAGRAGSPLRLEFNLTNVVGRLATESGVAIFKNPKSNVRLRLAINGSQQPALITACDYIEAELDLADITGYAQAPYSGFICSAGTLMLKGVKATGTTAANLGYAGGSSKVTLPATMSADVSTVRKGAGSTAVINQVTTSNYTGIV